MNPAKVESAMTLPSYFGNCGLHTLIHICSFEILLPHIVVILPELDINIAAIYVKLLPFTRILDLLIISLSSTYQISAPEAQI
jgi:hypothetical protein